MTTAAFLILLTSTVILGLGFLAALFSLGDQEKRHRRRLAKAEETAYAKGYAAACVAVNDARLEAEDNLIAAARATDDFVRPRGVSLDPAPPIEPIARDAA